MDINIYIVLCYFTMDVVFVEFCVTHSLPSESLKVISISTPLSIFMSVMRLSWLRAQTRSTTRLWIYVMMNCVGVL